VLLILYAVPIDAHYDLFSGMVHMAFKNLMWLLGCFGWLLGGCLMKSL